MIRSVCHKPMYCLFASEIAALIGANRYKSKEDVIIRIWKKVKKADYIRCKSKLDAESDQILQNEEYRAREIVNMVEKIRTKKITSIISNIAQTQRPVDI